MADTETLVEALAQELFSKGFTHRSREQVAEWVVESDWLAARIVQARAGEAACPVHSDEPMAKAVATNRRLLGQAAQPCTCAGEGALRERVDPNGVANGLREAVGQDGWFAIPLASRSRIVRYVAALTPADPS